MVCGVEFFILPHTGTEVGKVAFGVTANCSIRCLIITLALFVTSIQFVFTFGFAALSPDKRHCS